MSWSRIERSATALLAAALVATSAFGVTRDTVSRLDEHASSEVLHYRWQLRGVLGRIASLVLPGHGHGELRTRDASEEGFTTELEITSPEAADEEYYLYGSRSAVSGHAEEAWSAYRWRDEEESKCDRITEPGVVDVAAGIHLVRQTTPEEPLSLRIWSDGKIYPVVVEPRGAETITVPAGTFTTRHYRVHGVRRPDQRYWEGSLRLWLAQDEEATPIRIEVARGWTTVRLELLDQERS